MFCTKCGKKLEDNAVFCTGCGKPLEKQITPSTSGSMQEKQFLWQAFLPYVICALAGLMGFMKWIQIEIPFVGTFNGSYHIWSLVSLLKNVAEWTGENDIATAGLIVAIPVVLWIAGLVFTIVAVLVGVCADRKKMSGVLAIVASVFMTLSGAVYLFMVYWVKSQINEEMEDAFGIAIGGGIIKVPAWPWLMVVLGIMGVICAVLFLLTGKNIRAISNDHTRVGAVPQRVAIPTVMEAQQNGKNAPKKDSGILKSQSLGNTGFIVFQDISNNSKLYGSNFGNPIIMGRDETSCNIIIQGERSVSRKHCQIFRNGTMCYVEDLQSYNHTYVNEVIVSAPTPLKKGDRLRLGNLTLLVAECSMTGSI